MPTHQALRVAVLGAGKIGSAFAFQLARTGQHDVTVIARPGSARLTQLQSDAGILDVKGKRAEVRVLDALDEATPYDLVIVTLLAHQIDAVVPALQRCAAASILCMFNIFDPEQLRDQLGSQRCCFGMPFLQANFDADGKLNAKIGAGGQKTKLGQQQWVDVFTAAGLPAVLEPEMLLWLRCHAPLCVAFEAVSVAGVRRGGGASWAEAATLATGLQESFALIQGLGFRLYPDGKSFLKSSPSWVAASMLWSMSRIRSFRELLATGAGECRALVDALVQAVPRSNPAVTAARIEAMRPSGEPL
ncbi:MAG: ketopantoate reductase family protein [Janthinobacterium lividum]